MARLMDGRRTIQKLEVGLYVTFTSIQEPWTSNTGDYLIGVFPTRFWRWFTLTSSLVCWNFVYVLLLLFGLVEGGRPLRKFPSEFHSLRCESWHNNNDDGARKKEVMIRLLFLSFHYLPSLPFTVGRWWISHEISYYYFLSLEFYIPIRRNWQTKSRWSLVHI